MIALVCISVISGWTMDSRIPLNKIIEQNTEDKQPSK